MSELTSTKPYLLRAIYEWCVDNGLTPHISVSVGPNVRVPAEHVRNGEIVLNIGPDAAGRLRIGNEDIECTLRFSGVARELLIPVTAVRAIYARETGHGMTFEAEGRTNTSEADDGSAPATPTAPAKSGGKPRLKRVK